MSIRSRKQLDDKQIFAQIVEEMAKPRQAASVKKALEKKNLVAVSVGKKARGSKGRGKPESLNFR